MQILAPISLPGLPALYDIVLLILLLFLGLVLIIVLVKVLLFVLPAAIVALVVYLLTASFFWAGVAFLVVALISLLGR
jgi:hypothetical protein